MTIASVQNSQLGKKTSYENIYNPKQLFPVNRQSKRAELGIDPNAPLPFFGYDLWNHYEVSWLDPKGKPIVAIAEIIYSCASPSIIESKSMKLYFNTFNNTCFENSEDVAETARRDIAERVQADVSVKVTPLTRYQNETISIHWEGICLDGLDVTCNEYQVNPNLLKTENQKVEETIYSHLLKSNCLVTGQPDWGSVSIHYSGQKINHEQLLKYIVSFRDHTEFGEHCVERIYMDLLKFCRPDHLCVYGRYTRRGGMDINSFRASKSDLPIQNTRLIRQ